MNLPPETILSNTSEIINACEMAEVSVDPAQNATAEGVESPPPKYILVTELAALLHLGSYTHARHLWHRHRPAPSTASTVDTSTSASLNDEFRQFQLLWEAAKPLLKVYSSTMPNNTIHLKTELQTLFRSLFELVQSNQHPLSLFANELMESTRTKMTVLLERYYDSISVEYCANVLGFEAEEIEGMSKYLQERGWERKEGTDIWVPAAAVGECGSGLGVVENAVDEVEKPLDKIQFLTNVVGFMEAQRMNA